MNKETISPVKLSDLRTAFSNGFTDEEACMYAEVDQAIFYQYLIDNPEFTALKEELRSKPQIQAKMIVTATMRGERNEDGTVRHTADQKKMAKWFLEKSIDGAFRNTDSWL